MIQLLSFYTWFPVERFMLYDAIINLTNLNHLSKLYIKSIERNDKFHNGHNESETMLTYLQNVLTLYSEIDY